MASKRRLRRKQCGNKVRHATEEAAMKHYAALRFNKGELGLKVYHCRFCRKWHVGHWKRVA